MITLSDTTTQIEQIMELIADATEEYTKRLKASSEAEIDFKIAKAKKMLEAKTHPDLRSADMREAWVLVECEQQYEFYIIEQARCSAQKERLISLRDKLSACQSLQRVFTI